MEIEQLHIDDLISYLVDCEGFNSLDLLNYDNYDLIDLMSDKQKIECLEYNQ